ncbi:hypothetical protein [Enterococcus columbae]|nr:hypothetical protein [Enterococcus columbae]
MNKLEKIAAVFYPYRYWIFFSILFIIGFFGGIAVGLNHINK